MASGAEFAETRSQVAGAQELDALEASGKTGVLSDEQARRILSIPARRGDEVYLTSAEVRQRLGLPG